MDMKNLPTGLIGRPVTASFGQFVFNRIFSRMKIDSIYLPIDISAENLDRFFSNAFPFFRGINVTSPHKASVLKYCNNISHTASETQSVNIVVNASDGIFGDNLDPAGFQNLLKTNNISIDDKNITIIGSGGAARSVLYAIRSAKKFNSIKIATRRLEETRKKLKSLEIPVVPHEEAISGSDIIINCTPAGSQFDLGELSGLKSVNGIAIDLIYNPRVTDFLNMFSRQGWKTVNGSEMFIGQAVETFKILYGNISEDVSPLISETFYSIAEVNL